MTTQRNFLDGPCQISQGFLLPFKNIRGSFGLPKRLKIVLEQPADTPQFRDGVQIRMGGNSASEKRRLMYSDRDNPAISACSVRRVFSLSVTRMVTHFRAAVRPSPSFFLPFMSYAFEMREAKRRAFRESRGRSLLAGW